MELSGTDFFGVEFLYNDIFSLKSEVSLFFIHQAMSFAIIN